MEHFHKGARVCASRWWAERWIGGGLCGGVLKDESECKQCHKRQFKCNCGSRVNEEPSQMLVARYVFDAVQNFLDERSTFPSPPAMLSVKETNRCCWNCAPRTMP
jgi:hypothetical protein